MKNINIEVHHESDDIIWQMEETIFKVLGYRESVANIMSCPKDKIEDDIRKSIERFLFRNAMKRIRMRKNMILSHNQILLCEQN